jgi:hypothetical protein
MSEVIMSEDGQIPHKPKVKRLTKKQKQAIVVAGSQMGRDPMRQLQRMLKAEFGDKLVDAVWSMEDIEP